MMKQTKRKPLLNRKETQTLLTTLKVATAAGALSLTIGGWSLLAQLESRNIAQAATSQPVALVASAGSITLTPTPLPLPTTSSSRIVNLPASPTPLPTPAAPAPQKISLDIVQWVQDISGNKVAVVLDRRGSLWYVMGSDVPRLEQGLSPLVQPQRVRTTTRTRGS